MWVVQRYQSKWLEKQSIQIWVIGKTVKQINLNSLLLWKQRVVLDMCKRIYMKRVQINGVLVKRFFYATFKWYLSRRMAKTSMSYSLQTPDQNSHDNILVICTCSFVGKSDLIYLANLFFLPWLTVCWCNVFSSGTTEPGTDMLLYIFHHQGKNEQLPKVERVLDWE